MKIKIKQHVSTLTKSDLETCQNLVMVLPEGIRNEKWPTVAWREVLKERLSRDPAESAVLECDLPNATRTHISFGCVKEDISPFALLGLARQLIAPQLAQNPASLSLCMPGLPAKLASRVSEALLAALLAASERMPSLKSKPAPASKLKSILIYNQKKPLDTRRVEASAAGNNLARYLTTLPPNELTPGLYRKRVAKLAKQHGWKMQFHTMAALRKKKAGAFVAVAQGSPEEDAGILHLRYEPQKKSAQPAYALVGKGICFDTGGMNLKPARYMHGMHEDMEGSAVALGSFLALSELRVNFPVDCWLALAQNHIGPKAYKQNDVVTASNGTSIEIIHTDAEGRMVLADTLAFAAKKKPAMIIDYATLTGSCVAALGTNYSGAFTNRDSLIDDIIQAGRDSGERVWPFPIDDDYDKALDSHIADVKQCSLDGGADHILASRFLKRFVDDVPWLHVDLSAGNNKGGLAHIPTDITGFGVRFTLELLLSRQVQDKL
ncbi:M17 family metallopeptidase [Sulfuriflexus mobilis]|uniref:M17 family metallopeptidase n=1 Tax=Sulfuriflexus mobilis TaxID=1811807 RepID=UPI0018D4E33E|nr:leucyl aminopeptidase family protein [Sulfuriflexus mobilis]